MLSKSILLYLLMFPAVGCFVSNRVVAQVTSGEQETQEEQSPSVILQKMVSIDFSGGTVSDLIDQLQEQVEFNCIIQVEAKDFRLPEIKLNDVRASSVLDAMNFASNDKIVADYDNYPYVQITNEYLEPQQTAVFNLIANSKWGGEGGMIAAGEGGPAIILVEAIQAGLEFQGESSTPLLTKYHPDSGLFFVKGTPMQLAMVTQIVSEMTRARATTDIGGSLPLADPRGAAEGIKK